MNIMTTSENLWGLELIPFVIALCTHIPLGGGVPEVLTQLRVQVRPPFFSHSWPKRNRAGALRTQESSISLRQDLTGFCLHSELTL